jgi:hypothetical protein
MIEMELSTLEDQYVSMSRQQFRCSKKWKILRLQHVQSIIYTNSVTNNIMNCKKLELKFMKLSTETKFTASHADTNCLCNC